MTGIAGDWLRYLYNRWRAHKSVRAVSVRLPHTIQEIFKPQRWPRPTDNGFHDLSEEQIEFIQKHNQCPYCGYPIFGGPQGGMSINVFCGNVDECNSRFNIGFPPLPFGQFTGTVPEDFAAARRIQLAEERRLAALVANNAPMI